VPRIWIVVPCFDEAERLDAPAFEDYLRARPEVGFIFVNDGSRDDTLGMLRALEARAGARARVLDQQPNRGKAEAVRIGMLNALGDGAAYAGFLDADLATPLAALDELAEVLDTNPAIEIVFGARVALLGRQIERSALRHYSGRMFAAAASLVLALPIYDTQCGAKLFRASPAMRELFASPFGSRWIFDVEILARYLTQNRQKDGIYELPLKRWVDTGHSHVRFVDYLRAVGEMASIFRRYRIPERRDAAARLLGAVRLRRK
jgi:dolichyl-phosphate beta-glucosyltransferase